MASRSEDPREVTATFTTAGVTRAATASTALSRETSDETLLSSRETDPFAACTPLWWKKKAAPKTRAATVPAGKAMRAVLPTSLLVVAGMRFPQKVVSKWLELNDEPTGHSWQSSIARHR